MKYKELISSLTLEEKASLLSGKDFWQSKSIERLKIPSMTLADGPHGLRRQEGEADHLGLNVGVPATCFPTAATVANSWNPRLGEIIGEALAKEAIEQNINVILGPGLNIKRSPLCGRNFEYFSEDPYLSGKMASGYIRGIQSQGVVACPKHFVANNQEYLRMTNDSIIDKRTLHEIYLTGFEIAVKESSPKAIMSSYNRINGIYANENKELLRDVLVNDWGFDGIVVSDWGGSNNHIMGIQAGAHLEMPSTGGDSDRELVEGVREGLISEITVDQRVDEYLNVLYHVNKHENNNIKADYSLNHSLARQAAEESIVLLKNKEEILPLKKGTKISIIGDFAKKPRYQGAGSSLVNPTELENTIDVIDFSGLELIGYEQGYIRKGGHDEDMMLLACNLAKKSDVVLLYIGLDELSESEGLDRNHMSISQNQIDLLASLAKVNKNIIAVLSCGSVIEMPWIGDCKAVVHGYLAGQAGASAILNIITGKCNPSGKLGETYPIVYEDTPTYNFYPGKEVTSEYREGLYVGYRYYDTVDIKIRFPFGFGLSYTKFEYSNYNLSETEVSFTITNVGKVAGAEIAQLYISRNSNVIFRPKKELKGFKKVFLKVDESKRVVISLDDKAFRYYNVNTSTFEVESGEYIVMIGASSNDIRLSESIEIKGTTNHVIYDPKIFEHYFSGKIQNISKKEFEALINRFVPSPIWDRKIPLGRNDTIFQLHYAKSWVARLVYKLLTYLKNKSFRKGNPDLNILFIYNMPFRAIGKMMNGIVSMEMVDGLLIIINGKFFRGLGYLIRAYFRNKNGKRETKTCLNNWNMTKGRGINRDSDH